MFARSSDCNLRRQLINLQNVPNGKIFEKIQNSPNLPSNHLENRLSPYVRTVPKKSPHPSAHRMHTAAKK